MIIYFINSQKKYHGVLAVTDLIYESWTILAIDRPVEHERICRCVNRIEFNSRKHKSQGNDFNKHEFSHELQRWTAVTPINYKWCVKGQYFWIRPVLSFVFTWCQKKKKEVYFAVSHFDSLHKHAKAATLWYRCKCSNPPGGQNKWRFFKSCESYDSRDTHCLKKGAGYQWPLLIVRISTRLKLRVYTVHCHLRWRSCIEDIFNGAFNIVFLTNLQKKLNKIFNFRK